jgi:tetratricopeptide (TPR) repeat protein
LIAIAEDEGESPLVRANAVGYLRNYSSTRAVASLFAAVKSTEPVIRSTALSSLALSAGTGSGTPARSAFLGALDDPRRLVRLSGLASLVNAGGGPPGPDDEARLRRVSREYAAKARLYPDDAKIQGELGIVELLSGEFDRAADALLDSLGLDPDRPSTRFMLALARLGAGRVDEASALLRAVPPSDPYYVAALERLKTLSR